MLAINSVDPVEAIPLFLCLPHGPLPADWPSFCEESGLLALAAEQDGELVGFAIAQSYPRSLHILSVEGNLRICRSLLGRLVKLAGERNMSSWCPAERRNVCKILKGLGFTRQSRATLMGKPSYFYRWDRNEAGYNLPPRREPG